MGGWGEERRSAPVGTGTTAQIELAQQALKAVGCDEENLALGAIKAAGVIDRLRCQVAEQEAVELARVEAREGYGA